MEDFPEGDRVTNPGRRRGTRRHRERNVRVLPWYRPGEGNEARRDGRQEVAAPDSTVEAGELAREDPVEGSGRRVV